VRLCDHRRCDLRRRAAASCSACTDLGAGRLLAHGGAPHATDTHGRGASACGAHGLTGARANAQRAGGPTEEPYACPFSRLSTEAWGLARLKPSLNCDLCALCTLCRLCTVACRCLSRRDRGRVRAEFGTLSLTLAKRCNICSARWAPAVSGSLF